MPDVSRIRKLVAPALLLLAAWLLRSWHLAFYDFRGDEVFGIDYATAPLSQVIGMLATGEATSTTVLPAAALVDTRCW